ncbi:hypothetical protein TIFTF001_033565 [Ficus carica]|uniref:Fibrillarin n=1 Tax=Ficus carica TaxID=3494 RepID=A0AA88DYH8_FICCA|nr:hypothetical protein TIFTF001_033565 [Ficus carica]
MRPPRGRGGGGGGFRGGRGNGGGGGFRGGRGDGGGSWRGGRGGRGDGGGGRGRGNRGGSRGGGRGRPGMKGGSRVVVEPHRHDGKPGARILYLGAASGTTVSHVSDIVGPARILALNASYFLKAGGHFVISIKANCIDSTVPAEAVFQQEVKKLQADQFKPFEQVTLEPFERDHACVVGGYRLPKKQKSAA